MQELKQQEQNFQGSSNESPIFNITFDGFKQLVSSGIGLDALYLLEQFNNNNDLTYSIHASKVLAWKQNLLRKGYITESGTVTKTGASLLSIVQSGGNIAKAAEASIQRVEDDFEKWWKLYPPSDIFEHKGVKFQGSRSLKDSKEKCRSVFARIVDEGDHKVEDLIRALSYEVNMKKDASVRERANKMSYMTNSMTYLNQRRFENFIEISKQSIGAIASQDAGATDV